MLHAGEILGNRYEILLRVGTGGMASVYKAKDHRLNRMVAIKVLSPQFGDDKEFIKKFNIEAQSAAAFVHPNIVSIYDVGDEKGLHFIVMEYVDGETLKKYITSRGYLDAKQIVNLSIQIASGIKAAHDNKTIHRDIKPQNILILADGKTAKVTDFGIAKTSNKTTIKQITMGSVHYLSPEQARNGYTDERSDIYSLGITMYEMATGTVPFDGENNVVVALMHLEDEPIPPRQLQPTIPITLENIILKCIQKRKIDRYQSMKDLIEDLRKVFSDNPPPYLADDSVIEKNGRVSSTVILTKDDLDKIKKGITNTEEEEPKKREEPQERIEEETEEEKVDPKLEKIIVGLTAVTVAIIAGVILYFLVHTGVLTSRINSKSEPTTVEAAGETYVSTQNVTTKQKTEDEKTEDEKTEDDSKKTESSTNTEKQKTDEKEKTDQESLVPNLVGMEKDAAAKVLKETSLQVEYLYKYSEVEKDYIISQSIEAGTKITDNSTISLTVSEGSEPNTMPNVIGMTQKQAEEQLAQLSLNIQYSYADSDEEDIYHIVSQSIEAESEVKSGDKVILTIGTGLEEAKVIVPDLSYYTEEEAKEQLEKMGLKLGQITQKSSDIIAKGQIISQSVESKKKVEKGTKIDVVISSGVDRENYIYEGNLTIQSCPFSTEEKSSANLTLILEQKDKKKTIYDGLVTKDDFPLSVEFEGIQEGRAVIHAQVDQEDTGESYIVQVSETEK